MKIAVSFPGCHRRGGVERVMLETVNYLAVAGHQVHAISAECDLDLLDRLVTHHHVSCETPITALYLPKFVRHSAKMHVKLSSIDVAASFGMAAQPDSIIWLQSVHAAWIKISSQTRNWLGRCKQRLNPFHPVILSMEKRMLKGRRYRHLIALTQDEKNSVIRHYQVPAKDVSVLPNGYAEAQFNPTRCSFTRDAARAELGFTSKDKVLLFVANEIERKGLRQLCQAVARLDDQAIKIVAVGRLNPLALREGLHAMGIARQVVFTGPSNDVSHYHSAADLFVLPTQYEAWGLVIVEALASGVPVLTSRLAGAAQAVQPGVNGELLDNPLDPDEISKKIQSLLSLGLHNREQISASVIQFRWSNILKHYESILEAHRGKLHPIQ